MARLKHTLRAIGIVLGTLLAVFLIALGAGWLMDLSRADHRMGLTFSDFYAERELGLDWRETYRAILDELQPDLLRLVAYWNRIETEPATFDFSALDHQISEAERRSIPVILAVGFRTPRWP